MKIIADTHVHFYPMYDLSASFRHAVDHLKQLAPGAMPLLCLSERHDCHFFEQLSEGRLAVAGYDVQPLQSEPALRISKGDETPFFILAGRQIVSRERIEVLALATDALIGDGYPLSDTVKSVRASGGLPVLCWAPGKWTLERGRTIRQMIRADLQQPLLLGNTTLLPAGCRESALTREGRKKRLPVLAGSDPLPFEGEERFIGTYATCLEGAFDEARPATSFRNLVLRPQGELSLCGKRGYVWTVARRLYRNAMAKRAGEESAQLNLDAASRVSCCTNANVGERTRVCRTF